MLPGIAIATRRTAALAAVHAAAVPAFDDVGAAWRTGAGAGPAAGRAGEGFGLRGWDRGHPDCSYDGQR